MIISYRQLGWHKEGIVTLLRVEVGEPLHLLGLLPPPHRPEAPKTPSSNCSCLAQRSSIGSFPAVSSFLSGEGAGAREK